MTDQTNDVTVAVVLPTWRRPEMLQVCLAALARQSRLPSRVYIVAKVDDVETASLVSAGSADWDKLNVTCITVPVSGNFVTQLNAGVQATSEDLIAFTDDDAEPWRDWLERLATVFAQRPDVGGVGGRDWQPHERWDVQKVGIISWFGRTVGNHHLGSGPARDVDLLKGVNCCIRGDELRRIGFDCRLRGRANVTHSEMSLCFEFRRAGWKLVYDPAIAVDHRPAPRHDGDINARGGFEPASFADAVHNETLAVLSYLSPRRRLVFLLWTIAVGTSAEPGLAQLVRLMIMRPEAKPFSRWIATCRGRILGVRTFAKSARNVAAISPR